MPPGGDTLAAARPCLIAHIIFKLDVGGLENGLVNLINHMPEDRFRHVVICLTDYTEFRDRIRRADVSVHALHKPPGNHPGIYFRLWRLLRELRPDIVHTRNLAALEGMLPAALAGVPARIHSEHGREGDDLDGERYLRLRRLLDRLVHHYIALSRELEHFLREKVGASLDRVSQICNGVDTGRFHPAAGREPLPCPGFDQEGLFVIGTVGRMQPVKDQLTLVRAFILLLDRVPDGRRFLRLAVIGDGTLREQALALLDRAGARALAWFPGARDDVPELMRAMDLFVLPSLSEGISNTLLEAMATGLPVVATAVGGNPELVEDGRTGTLVPAADPEAMAAAMAGYVLDPDKRRCHGQAARRAAERNYSLDAMVRAYTGVYDKVLAAK